MALRTRALTALGALVVGIALAACTTPATDPSPSSTRTPSTSASAEPAVATVRIGAGDVTLLDVDGETTETLEYTDDAPTLSAALEKAFGSAPEKKAYAGHQEEQPGTDYVWGGFTLRVLDPNPQVPDENLVNYLVTAAAVGDVKITAGPDDVAVGSTVTSIVTPPGSDSAPVEIDGDMVRLHAADLHELGGVDDFGIPLADFVSARVGSDGVVTQLYALNHTFGV